MEKKKFSVVFELPTDKWESFVDQHPFGNIFQTPGMFALYNVVPNHKGFLIAIVDAEQEILGLMSCCLIAEDGLKSFFSRRSIVFGGPLIRNEDLIVSNILLSEYNKAIRSKVIYTQFRNIWPVEKLSESLRQNNFKYEDHLTVLVDLTVPEADLINNINKKRMNSIRSSKKKGLSLVHIRDDQFLEKAVNLINLTYKRIGLPAPPNKLFYQAKKILGDRVQFFGSLYQGEIIGVRVCLRYKDLTYDWYAGSDLQFSSLRPNDLLPMECILWAKHSNARVYDFGGAGKPGKSYGVRDFKLQYGGKLANYGRYTNVHNALMYKIGEFGVKMIKRSAKTNAN